MVALHMLYMPTERAADSTRECWLWEEMGLTGREAFAISHQYGLTERSFWPEALVWADYEMSRPW
jgi:hypothetical protein